MEGLTHQERRETLEKLVGHHVVITYVDGHRERVYLHNVGYQGFTVLVKGQRQSRSHFADVVSVVPKES